MTSTDQSISMVVYKTPGPDEIVSFLASRTGAQMAQLVQAIREPAAAASLARAFPQTTPSNFKHMETRTNAKRALNAFTDTLLGYYLNIPAFKMHAMKKLSRPMSKIWKADPNIALWILLTKAWSKIRDQIGKNNAPLNEYLAIVCPYLEIPSPESYFDCLGWEFNYIDESPSVYRVPDPPPKCASTGIAAMGLSIEDIISYCKSKGFAEPYVLDMNINSPTFLGQSPNTAVETNPPNRIMMPTDVLVHRKRVVAKKQRRTRQKNTNDTSRPLELQKGFAGAFVTGGAGLHSDETLAQGIEAYDRGFADTTINRMTGSYNRTTCPNDSSFDRSLDQIPIDWSAFRVGADEGATLLPFDSSNSIDQNLHISLPTFCTQLSGFSSSVSAILSTAPSSFYDTHYLAFD